MKSFFKQLEPCSGVQESAIRKLECCDPLLFSFDSDQHAIRIFDLDHQLLGVCQKDLVPEFLSLSAQGQQFSFSVEEIRYGQNVDGIMESEIFLNVAAYAPGEVESAVADIARHLKIKV